MSKTEILNEMIESLRHDFCFSSEGPGKNELLSAIVFLENALANLQYVAHLQEG